MKNKMRFILSLLLMMLLCSTAVHAEVKLSSILEKIVENNKEFGNGMAVPYEREIISRSLAMLDDDFGADKASGTFYFKEPHFLKIEQVTPAKEDIISNGKSIWWYVPEEKTAYRHDNMGDLLEIYSMIFMGLKNPEETFDVTIEDSESSEFYQLTLTPKNSFEEIDHLSVTVSADEYRIVRIENIDIIGNITRFKLGKFEKKEGLDESFFDFKVPEGVKVIVEE